MFWRNMRLAVLGFVVTAGGLVFFQSDHEDIFEARSLLLFALGREYIFFDDNVGTGVRAPNPGDFQGVVNAEMLLFDNPNLSRDALERVGMERVFYAPEEEINIQEAVLWFQQSTRVELITGSYVVQVSVRHPSPEIAAELTNSIVESFQNRRNQLYSNRETSSLRVRLQAANDQAVQIEGQIKELLSGLDAEVVQGDLASVVSDQAYIRNQMRETGSTVSALEARRGLLRSQLGGDNEILEVDLRLQEETSRLEYFAESLAENEKELRRLSVLMPKLRQLLELRDEQNSRISTLELRLRESVALAGQASDTVRVIETAVPPLRSVSMPERVRLAIGILISLFMGAVAFGIGTLLSSGGFKPEQGQGEHLSRRE